MPDNPPLNRNLAEALRELRSIPQWAAFADMAVKMTDHWQKRLVQMNLQSETIEQIAKDRIRWTSMIAGVQTVLIQMDELITELNRKEKEEDEKPNSGEANAG